MDNLTFLHSIGIDNEETIAACLTAMEAYNDNKWWEPDVDPRKYAYYQLSEDFLPGSFSHFHEALELLLGRPVFTHELSINIDALRQEAERAWTYQVGVTSEHERSERVQQSMSDLNTWASEHGKEVIIVQLPDED